MSGDWDGSYVIICTGAMLIASSKDGALGKLVNILMVRGPFARLVGKTVLGCQLDRVDAHRLVEWNVEHQLSINIALEFAGA